MPELPYLKMFTGDYLRDTAHLTLEEHGAYHLLLYAAWARKDCALPPDDQHLARIVGVGTRRWKRIKISVLEAFFEQNDSGYWLHNRLVIERKLALQNSEVHARSGRIGGLKTKEKSQANAEANAEAHHSHSQTLSEQNSDSEYLYAPIESVEGEGRVKEKRGTRIPPNWQPSSEDIGFALNEGFNHDAAQRIAEQFIDHWTSATYKATKRDWCATWRTWIRREADQRRRGKAGGGEDVARLAANAAATRAGR